LPFSVSFSAVNCHQDTVAGRIPQHFIDELVARTDIIEVIGNRVPLKKAGKDYKACCPFHDEKTPSFTVVPDKQFYHCFGCGAHGTSLGFLMDYDHLSFVEAIEELATRAGLQVPREEDATARPKPGDDLYATLEKTTELYRRELKNSERAKDYVKARGLTGETAARFGIGYAPDAWDAVLKQVGVNQDAVQRLLQVGLIIERERRSGNDHPGHYDRFRDRIMFPIRDARGRTIGFGGRVLDKGEPKYLNSPETELFHKGKELYGLFEARQSSRNLNRIMVVEGYMDVVRLHQAGITYAVATLGTATTSEHLTRLFRICNELVFCFDGDRAGRAAAWRALENSLAEVRQGRQIRFLFLPEGQDPDSLVGAEGREAFEARLGQASTLSEYFIRELSARADVNTIDGRAQLAEMARPLVNRIPPGVYRELLVDELSRVIRMPPERLLNLLTTDQPGTPRTRIAETTGPLRRTAQPQQPSTGRRNLVRQAVHMLVHFPSAASAVQDVEALHAVDRPGIPVLLALLNDLSNNPCPNTGALLERWRGRPDYDSLAKLATHECLVHSSAAAAQELSEAVDRLVKEEQPARRTEELLAKARLSPLSTDEKLELQGLLSDKAARSATSRRRT
jgi:DNA primase